MSKALSRHCRPYKTCKATRPGTMLPGPAARRYTRVCHEHSRSPTRLTHFLCPLRDNAASGGSKDVVSCPKGEIVSMQTPTVQRSECRCGRHRSTMVALQDPEPGQCDTGSKSPRKYDDTSQIHAEEGRSSSFSRGPADGQEALVVGQLTMEMGGCCKQTGGTALQPST